MLTRPSRQRARSTVSGLPPGDKYVGTDLEDERTDHNDENDAHETRALRHGRACPEVAAQQVAPADHQPDLPQHHTPVSYTHLRAHETDSYLVCRLLLEKKKKTT